MRLSVSASELLRSVESGQLRKKIPAFTPGDTLRVTLRVPEGDKERLQVFEGVVIGRRGGGTREMVRVRKISFGIGVERTFPLHSPFISKIELVGRGKARRAKLYFLREKTGKAARLKKQFLDVTAEENSTETPAPAEQLATAPAETAVEATEKSAGAAEKPEASQKAAKKD